ALREPAERYDRAQPIFDLARIGPLQPIERVAAVGKRSNGKGRAHDVVKAGHDRADQALCSHECLASNTLGVASATGAETRKQRVKRTRIDAAHSGYVGQRVD